MLLQATALTDPSGIWQFGALSEFDPAGNFVQSTFLQNIPKRFQGGIASTLSPRDLRQTLFGGYIQDDWRWQPNLTLNLGLRYEMATIPTEIHGKLANLRDLSSGSPHLGDPFFNSNPTTKNLEPRVGFAWDPFRNGKMALRGGAGLFDVLPLPYQFILLVTQAAPFFEYTSIKNPGTGTFFDGVLPPFPANKLRATYTDPNPKRNYVAQWNLNCPVSTHAQLGSDGRLCWLSRCASALPRGRRTHFHTREDLRWIPLAESRCVRKLLYPTMQCNRSQRPSGS